MDLLTIIKINAIIQTQKGVEPVKIFVEIICKLYMLIVMTIPRYLLSITRNQTRIEVEFFVVVLFVAQHLHKSTISFNFSSGVQII